MKKRNKNLVVVDANKDRKNNLCRSIFFSAMFILFFIFLNIFISSTMFIFHVSISPFFPIISLILSIVFIALLLKKNSLLKNLLYPIISICIPIVLIGFSVFLNGEIYDYTWDGNSYHKSTIGMMAEGWNPVYENMENFDLKDDSRLFVKSNSYVWGNHYAKASHIFAANIYKLTGNIETGKCINTLSIIMLFLFIFSFLTYKKKKILFPLLFTICTISYPILGAQYLTNYVDLLLYIYLVLIIFSFFIFEDSNFFTSKFEVLLMFFMILVITINIKFSAFGYAGLFCLGYFLWYIYRFLKNKIDKRFFVNFTIVSTLSVLVSVFIVGLSVYPKNFMEHGHLFYPLFGEGKIEIMIQNQPDYFKEKSPIEKFVISTFSKAENISESSGQEGTFKIPFTFTKDELTNLSSCDLRLSGNGVLFSGIFILSIVILLCLSGKVYKNNKQLFILSIIPLAITFIMIFVLGESWWARYFPQLYFFVLFALLYLNETNVKIANILLYSYISIVLVNNMLTFYYSTNYSVQFSKDVAKQFYEFNRTYSNKGCELTLYTENFHGALYNVIDKEKKYEIKIIDTDNYEYIPGEFNSFMYSFVGWRCE